MNFEIRDGKIVPTEEHLTEYQEICDANDRMNDLIALALTTSRRLAISELDVNSIDFETSMLVCNDEAMTPVSELIESMPNVNFEHSYVFWSKPLDAQPELDSVVFVMDRPAMWPLKPA